MVSEPTIDVKRLRRISRRANRITKAWGKPRKILEEREANEIERDARSLANDTISTLPRILECAARRGETAVVIFHIYIGSDRERGAENIIFQYCKEVGLAVLSVEVPSSAVAIPHRSIVVSWGDTP